MATNGKNRSSTSLSISGWTQHRDNTPQFRTSYDTNGISSDNVVLMQAHDVAGHRGARAWLVQIDPASVGRKLLIRRLNDEIKGRTIKSHTLGIKI